MSTEVSAEYISIHMFKICIFKTVDFFLQIQMIQQKLPTCPRLLCPVHLPVALDLWALMQTVQPRTASGFP